MHRLHGKAGVCTRSFYLPSFGLSPCNCCAVVYSRWSTHCAGPAAAAEDWEGKQREMREKEWAIHEEMITAGRAAMDRWRDSDKVPNLIEIAKVFELACRLGRMAAGLPLSYTEVSGKVESPIRIDIEAALQRAYGSAADADVESIPVVEEVREGPSSAVLDEGRAEKSIPFVEDVGEGTMAHCYRSSQPAKETGSNSSPSGSSNDAIGGCCV